MATVDVERRAEIGRQKRARTRASLIDVALTLLADRGFDAPTIDDFIAAADVAKGTFYNHFKTKEELVLAAAGHVADSVDALILPHFRGVSDPAHRVAIAVRLFIRISKARRDWGWILVRTTPAARGAWSEDMRRGVLADIRNGRRLGRFEVPSIQAAVALGMGTLAMAIRTTLTERTPQSFPEMIAAMMLQGLGMDKAEAERVANLALPEEGPLQGTA